MSDTGEFLSLLAHAIDVATVFRALCDVSGIRRALSKSSDIQLCDGHFDRLAVLAMLHDSGKANLGFQDKIFPGHEARVGHIRELQPLFYDRKLNAKFLQSLPAGIETWFPNNQSADSYICAIFSHHGRPISYTGERFRGYTQARKRWWQSCPSRDPFEAIAEISEFAKSAFPLAFSSSVNALPDEPRFHHRFAGLLMLADWLGSHDQWFPVEYVDPKHRLEDDMRIAPKLLQAIGLDSDHNRQKLKETEKKGGNFTSRFGLSPRPLQKVLDGLDPHNPNAQLTVIESETGSGKTEAALNWFYKLFLSEKVDSLFFALPTRVAARELYGRIDDCVNSWFSNPQTKPTTLLAVPGYAQIDGYSVRELIPDVKRANIWQEDAKTLLLDRYWAGARPKRFLAATISVGTIDQALLSIIQTAHAHLRSICLDRSLIVVDEVHASDIYMSHLLQKLLSHHLGVGGYATLLSATLGSKALYSYMQITNPDLPLPDIKTATQAPYPSLTLANGDIMITPSASHRKEVYFELKPWALCPEKIAHETIIPALRAGARVLVVMNTVNRAVDMLKSIEKHTSTLDTWLFKCEDKVCPHHGRFAPLDREILDRSVSARWGKGSPPGPVVLVGTQTLEQSLDIDADILITDLAPSDVLLQRIGRLHRHRRKRPKGYLRARCVILVPEKPMEMALNTNGEVRGTYKSIGYGSVYEDLRSLELTLRLLKERAKITIPDDNRLFVERTTHPEAMDVLTGDLWNAHGNEISGRGIAKRITADTITTANMFDEYFGNIRFTEQGEAVSTRLGINQLHIPLDRRVLSPFGNLLSEMVIPGYMVPDYSEDEILIVDNEMDDTIKLKYGHQIFNYSRYGLEEIS